MRGEGRMYRGKRYLQNFATSINASSEKRADMGENKKRTHFD